MVVKRYSNRRLYDTETSRYVTLDEIAARIEAGSDIRFVDAPTGEDITQLFLAQIILESRGGANLFPVPLLYRLVRLGDDSLAEFFGRYVTWALDVYLRMKSSARTAASYNPFLSGPMAATEAFARWLGASTAWAAPPTTTPQRATGRYGAPAGGGSWNDPPTEPGMGDFPMPPGSEQFMGVAEPAATYYPFPREAAHEARPDVAASSAEVAALRSELEALKSALMAGATPIAAPREKPVKARARKIAAGAAKVIDEEGDTL